MQTSQGPVDRGVHPLQWQGESHRETTFKYGVYLQTNFSQNLHGREKIRERNKRKKTDCFFEKDVLYFLSDAFPFFVARNETDREAYCFSLSKK